MTRIWDETFEGDGDWMLESDDGSVYVHERVGHGWLEDQRFRLRKITVFPRRFLLNRRLGAETDPDA